MIPPPSAGTGSDLPRLLRPIFIQRAFSGLSSYEDIRSGRRNLPKLAFGLAFILFLLTSLGRFAIRLYRVDKSVHQIGNITVLYVSNIIQLCIIALYPCLYYVADLYFSPLMRRIFTELEDLDVHGHKCTNQVRNGIIFYYIAVSIGLILRWVYFYRVLEFTFGVSCVVLAYTFVFSTYAYYISILAIVKNELRAINKTIKVYLKHGQYEMITKDDIYRLDKKYNTLFNITLRLNENYSILLVMTFLMDTMGMASGIFKVSQNFIQSYISSSSNSITPLFLHELDWWAHHLCFILWVTDACVSTQQKVSPLFLHELDWWAHHLCFILWVTDACVSTQQKALKSTMMAHKLHLHNTNPELTAATGTFRRHLKLQEMKFTGCDMFEFNYETMLTILSTMGTYGIILIQFQIQIASQQ
ncbi:hypothetical protein M8J77_022746 [Diaphorina citri]|nr:hypothetical protein M8J77_022746 [Diaphorina citri]